MSVVRRAGRGCRASFLACSGVAILLTGCARETSHDLQPGSYRAVVDVGDGRQVPFDLDVAREEGGFVLYLVNGDERVRVTEVETRADNVTARMPGYETVLAADVTDGNLAGTLTLAHPADRTLTLPFHAQLGQTWRFFDQRRNDNADMAGRWEVRFADATGRVTRAIAQLEQRADRVTGTVVGPAGDQRYLAGEVHDEELRLSRFDGGALVLYRGQLDAKGRWVGEAWTDRQGVRRFVAERDADTALVPAAAATRTARTDGTYPFEFPGLDGKPVASTDPQFAGKVLLVAVSGSWNPNGHDQAALLAELDRRYRERGLAVVGLMREQHAAFEPSVRAIERMRAAHEVRFTTLVATPTGDTALADPVMSPALDVEAGPLTLFIDRKGQLRHVHAGFHGPASGPFHDQTVREFEETIEKLLAEAPGPTPIVATGAASTTP